MSKADELLRELFDARVAWINAVPGSEGRLTYAFATAGAYLNPIKDAGGARAEQNDDNVAVRAGYQPPPRMRYVGQSTAGQSGPASPPHAAAEPEKPMESKLQRLLTMPAVDAQINDFADLQDAYKALYASPSAQPIARDEQDAKRYRLLRRFWWNFGTSNYVHEGQIGGKKFWDGLDAVHDADTPDKLDAAIDAALKSAGKESI